MENKTHWKQLVNPNYLGVYSLPDGQDMTVIIDSVSREMVVQAGGKKEECTVAKIKGNKPMILNRTNCKTISKLYDSPYIQDWEGKQITIYASTTKLAGDIVECLRVRPIVVPIKKPSLDAVRFNSACEKAKTNPELKRKLLENYDLTQEQRNHASTL